LSAEKHTFFGGFLVPLAAQNHAQNPPRSGKIHRGREFLIFTIKNQSNNILAPKVALQKNGVGGNPSEICFGELLILQFIIA